MSRHSRPAYEAAVELLRSSIGAVEETDYAGSDIPSPYRYATIKVEPGHDWRDEVSRLVGIAIEVQAYLAINTSERFYKPILVTLAVSRDLDPGEIRE